MVDGIGMWYMELDGMKWKYDMNMCRWMEWESVKDRRM